MKRALITGITGQDGSYLAELLLSKGYEVHGTIRRSSTINNARIDHLSQDVVLHHADLTDSTNILHVIQEVEPTEIYNLAAQSHVKVSFQMPAYTAEVDALGAVRILHSLCILGMEKDVRFYQASTSEMFGMVQEIPQRETTPFYPRSPYGVAKLYGHWITKNYRESMGIHASSGILFNHESPRRGETFVTRKISIGLSKVKAGLLDYLPLGNLNAKRDWGHAKDFVDAMWLMLQQEEPDDYVIATEEQHSVREFVEKCAPYFGMNIEWQGEGLDEIGIDTNSDQVIIRVSDKYFRPSEVDTLVGDSSKARNKLGWEPKISFDELVRDMCLNEIKF
ncbi:MAG: GDP-mannose 4,6-dehydratase [Alphaproteobacteria bacterium]|nr:GDP-mannose 4,6-dehydratase [Alphaproteobacteria bacterium]